jgi:hypothetical protein
MPQIYANNVAGILSANIGPSDTLVLLGSGQGSAFPSPSNGDYYYATLVHQVTGVVEVVQVTARSADTLTVVRGRDNTSATSFVVGSVIEHRVTAQMLRDIDWRTSADQAGGVPSLGLDTRLSAARMPTSVPIMTDGKLLIGNIPDVVVIDSEMTTALGNYMPKASPTSTGTLTADSIRVDPTGQGVNTLSVGNDALFRDVNLANTMGLQGTANAALGYIKFGNGNSPSLGWDGTNLVWGPTILWHSNNFNPSLKANLDSPIFTGDVRLFDAVLQVRRPGQPQQGLIYMGNAAAYILYDGSNYSFNGGNCYAGDFISTSDRKAKANIVKINPQRGIADQLKLASYTMRQSGESAVGPIAQDVQKYAPHRVSKNADTGLLGVDKAGLALDMIADLAERVRLLEKQLKKG